MRGAAPAVNYGRRGSPVAASEMTRLLVLGARGQVGPPKPLVLSSKQNFCLWRQQSQKLAQQEPNRASRRRDAASDDMNCQTQRSRQLPRRNFV
jgi:hypothetical protein